ncbi:MAG: pantoate--beta-alanine ligase [Bacteroidia bacterium]|nr:pantoate--beta-alanine ligase [Bacteroidia bacterium]
MKIYKKAKEIIEYLDFQRVKNTLGFVPTMGALHDGHLSLISESISENDLTICSIFVNPTQFNQKEDFEKYPRMVEKDLELLKKIKCDVVFLPELEEIYPGGADEHKIDLDLGHLGKILEAVHRPGHFEGVVQVVYRLFDLIQPHVAYFGKKDYQQCKVIELLAKTHFPEIEIVTMPTLREPSGLALSSRNERLSNNGKQKALAIFNALTEARQRFLNKDPIDRIKFDTKEKYFDMAGLNCEYFEICSQNDLLPLSNHEANAVILTAVWVDGVRLIDNMEV